jgi:hypothetical protein
MARPGPPSPWRATRNPRASANRPPNGEHELGALRKRDRIGDVVRQPLTTAAVDRQLPGHYRKVWSGGWRAGVGSASPIPC